MRGDALDIARPFKAVFADPEWLKKMALAGVVSLVPVLNIALSGYLLAYQRNVAEGRDDRLPDWSDLGEYWLLGFQVMMAGFVYFIPVVIIGVAAIGIPIAADLNSGGDAFAGAIVGVLLFYAVMLLFGLVMGVVYMALMTHFNHERRFSAFFQFGEVWRRVRGNAGVYFGAIGMSIAVSMAMGFVIAPISYGASFATYPMLMGIDSEEAAIAAILTSLAIQLLLLVAIVFAYQPAYHIMFHYFGQYMGVAYDVRRGPVGPGSESVAPEPPAPEPSDTLLPPPPSSL
jgi:hypothetical protein